MIDNLANDPRILAPVGRIIASTERIFLQAVAQDIRIASDTSHPARNLLAAIASKSLAFSSEAAAGFSEFLEDVRNLVVHLAQGDLSDPQRFVDLLERFDNKIVERQAVVYENRRGTKQSVLAAAQRNVVAKKIAEEILARRDYVSSNRVIEDFLTGPWSQVLALERQVIDADTTGMRKAVFNLTLGELLWTLNFKRTAAHPKRLAKLSPSVLDRVRGGLLSIDWPPADSQAFFDSVLAIHQASLNSSDAPEPDLTTENKTSPTASVAEGATATPKAEVRSALNRLFAAGDDVYDADVPQQLFGRRGSGASKNFAPQSERRFEPTQPFVDTAPASQPSLEPEGFQFDSVELKLGAWVEMTLDGRQVRAQLTWISLYKTLCIFTSTDGATHSMSESLLHYFLLQGMVKVISAEGVLA